MKEIHAISSEKFEIASLLSFFFFLLLFLLDPND